MALDLWWSDRPDERYWMEITDREVLGDDLYAPQLDGVGKEQWSYTLVTETRPRRCRACGVVAGDRAASVGSITWQTRGTRGRARAIATTGASWRMQCGGFNAFEAPLTRTELNRRAPEIRRIHDELQRTITGTLYFPFIFYRPGDIRARQAYLTKFPAALVAAFPQLSAVSHRRGRVRRAVGVPRTVDPLLRKTIEMWAVERAKAHYLALGATRIEERGKPYDLVVYGLGPVRHVEVKGSSVEAVAVELTVNEVAHARTYPHTDLVVVDDIAWQPDGGGGYTASGGEVRIWESWQPDEGALSPTRFRYDLPA